jgi:hypothetical protein
MRNHGRCPPPPLPPPVALRHPFKRNALGRHITGNARCAYFGEIQARGGGMHKFSLWWKIRGISPQWGCGRHRLFCHRWPFGARSNATRLVATSLATWCTLVLWKFERGGGINKFVSWQKMMRIATKIRNNQMFFCRRPHPSDARSGAINPLDTLLATPCALVLLKFKRGGEECINF